MNPLILRMEVERQMKRNRYKHEQTAAKPDVRFGKCKLRSSPSVFLLPKVKGYILVFDHMPVGEVVRIGVRFSSEARMLTLFDASW